MYASNHPVKKAELKTKNAQGLSPFNLAAKLARSEIFTKMLEVNEIVILLSFLYLLFFFGIIILKMKSRQFGSTVM